MTTPALFEVPKQARPGPTANDVVILDASKANPKAHRPHPKRAKEPYKPGPRPFGARRANEERRFAYDGDRRATACGWDLVYTRHLLLVQLDESTPLCRSCWPVTKP